MKRIQTRKALADIYGVDRETITRWLARIDIKHRASLTPIEVEMIVLKIGTPEQLKNSARQLGIG